MAVVLLVPLLACSSTSYSIKETIVVPREVRPPQLVPPDLTPYVPRFIDVLQDAGFSVQQTDDPRALQLWLNFDPDPWNMRVTVSLVRDGAPILTAEARNAGWGNMLAQGASVKNLADSALTQFSSELKQVRLTLRIEPAAAPNEAANTRQAHGIVNFYSEPSSAEVWLDGKLIGSTPLEGYPLATGEHHVAFKRAGYQVWVRDFSVAQGVRTQLTALLERQE
ncbi:MAG TPA: PEGA domain-containing protein [Thermoanaerobaculia bacterium]|nr:PEGA domain-containing protein [Thermoanaerobaculia bacterium]